MTEETILLTREKVKTLLVKLEKFPDAASICPRCENVFSDFYEACNCARFD